MTKNFYITTAIAYPNSTPHIGHALEIIQADVLARFHRLTGKSVFFQTGTDEHGLKNWQTAQKQGKTIHEFLDANVNVFKKLYKRLNVSNDYFIRTSDTEVHYPSASKLWEALVKSDDIYKKKYEGLYCAGCESFKTPKELANGQCPTHPTRKIQAVEEENYFFRLSKYKDQIIQAIESDEYKVVPKIRKNEILEFLKDAKDISFSRPKSTLPWGIPVPNDPEQVMYVWCDALANYITGVKYGIDNDHFKKFWPADIHVVGKDILRFHAAFWPAMLLSANVPLPKQLCVHGFVLAKGGMKMGKSMGNVIEPFDQIEKYGVDPFRAYILGSMPINGDGEYSEDILRERVNTELVGNLSNFCYRVLSFTNKNFESTIGKVNVPQNANLIAQITSKFEEVKTSYESFDIKKVIEEILVISDIGNQYFQKKEPWKAIKEDKESAHETISFCVNLVKNLCIAIEPIMPEFAQNLQTQLNIKKLQWEDINFDLTNHTIGQAKIILTKVEEPQQVIEEIKETSYDVHKKVVAQGVKVRVAQLNFISLKKKHEGIEKLKKALRSEFEQYERKEVLDEYNNIDKKASVDSQQDPNSVINLFNLIREKGQLPQINTVVDVYNIMSLKSNISMATHDIEKLNGSIHVRPSMDGEQFISLDNTKVNLKGGEVIYADDKKIIGRFSKQCAQTSTTKESRHLALVCFGNKLIPDEEMDSAIKETCELITKYNGGEYKILKTVKEFPLNLKVAQIEKVEQHPDADKLYILQISLGEDEPNRQLVAGIKQWYTPEDLKGRKIVIVSNLKKAKLRGQISEGMLLTGEVGDTTVLWETDKNPGEQITVEGYQVNEKRIQFEDFTNTPLTIKDKKIWFENTELQGASVDIDDGAKVM